LSSFYIQRYREPEKNKGRIVAMVPPERVLIRDNIKIAYGIDVWIDKHPIAGTLYIVP